MKNNAKIIGMLIRKYRIEQNMSQEGLCQGICAVSYLSKIEKGTITCSDEIKNQLFDVLGISVPDNMRSLEKYSTKIDDFFHSYFMHDNENTKEVGEELLKQRNVLIHSNLSIDMMLVEAYWSYSSGADKEVINNKLQDLLQFKDYMDTTQGYRLYILMGHFETFRNNDFQSAFDYFSEAHKLRVDGVSLEGLTAANYGLGNYIDSILIGSEAYSKLMEDGNIEKAVFVCSVIAASYANLRVVDKMLLYYNRVLSLKKSDRNPSFLSHIYYNIGCAYLVTRHYQESIDFLTMSYNIQKDENYRNPDDYATVLQKLILAHMAVEEKEQAGFYLKLSEDYYEEVPFTGSLKASLNWLQKMCTIENYLYSEDYLNANKEVYEASLKDSHRGFNFLYGEYLADAYKKQRKYKEALKIIEVLYSKSQFS